ncbi:hypothetical protein COX58_01460 [archaeon CG_4_10_14_0_2_um_filter_Archaea_38_6]|nr:MAG: hypothetical protein COS64_02480 [archaeon CG06_land_8_20_14_3_00_37_11]PJA22694.1 MAG: hypothetical protein COX58_01460 [archaeon CG_4_10_14_0_2_um_filter_Archaea_38_6]
MSEEQFKRLTAFKTRIVDVMNANFVAQKEGIDYLEFDKLRVSRIRIIATVVNKRVNEERSYAYLVLDDGTETIRVKAWKEDVEKLEKPLIGDIIELIGRVREWETERYLTCETLKIVKNPNHWLYHKVELLLTKEKVQRIEEKEEIGISTGVEAKKEEKEDIEETILKIIKTNDMGKGTALKLIIKELGLSNKKVENVLKTLLIDGLIYEPTKHNYRILEV